MWVRLRDSRDMPRRPSVSVRVADGKGGGTAEGARLNRDDGKGNRSPDVTSTKLCRCRVG